MYFDYPPKLYVYAFVLLDAMTHIALYTYIYNIPSRKKSNVAVCMLWQEIALYGQLQAVLLVLLCVCLAPLKKYFLWIGSVENLPICIQWGGV